MENNLTNDQREDVLDGNAQYIEAIETLKKNSVPKEKYETLKDENRQLLQSLINGERIESQEAEETPDICELRSELFDPYNQMTNLEYISKTLKLRDTIISGGGNDPFLPVGKNIAATDTDRQIANKVAEIFKECVEYADGDNELFTQELQRRTIDVMPAMGRRK